MSGRPQQLLMLGSDHLELGAVAARVLPPSVGAAISAGRFPKPVPPVDPNEDAVLAAVAGGRALLAVADGHHGFDAAAAAVEALAGAAGSLLAPEEHAAAAVREALRVATVAAREAGALSPSGSETALTVAVTAPGGGAVGTIGDTAAVHLGGRRPRVVSRPTPFSGHPRALDRARVADVRLAPGDRLLLASDGLYDFLGRGWERRLADLAVAHEAPGELAEAAVRLALAAGASDNVAVALWAG